MKLTGEQKKAVIALFGFIGMVRADDFLEEFYVSPAMRKQINFVAGELEKLGGMLDLRHQDFEQLKTDVEKGRYSIATVTSKDQQDILLTRSKDRLTVARGDLDEVLLVAFEKCEGCTRNVKACQFRKALKKMQIEPYDTDKIHKCEYCISRGEQIKLA